MSWLTALIHYYQTQDEHLQDMTPGWTDDDEV